MHSCHYMPKLPQLHFFFLKILKLLLNLLVARYRKKRSLLLFFCLFSGAILFAQQKITGIVSGENKVPLVGATVLLLSSNISVVTGSDGSFNINAKPGDVF